MGCREGGLGLLLREPIRLPEAFWDTHPPVVTACPSPAVAISASTFHRAASNASQSKTMLVQRAGLIPPPPFHVSFAYICIAHRFLGGEEELERHILYSFYFFPLSAELHLFI